MVKLVLGWACGVKNITISRADNVSLSSVSQSAIQKLVNEKSAVTAQIQRGDALHDPDVKGKSWYKYTINSIGGASNDTYVDCTLSAGRSINWSHRYQLVVAREDMINEYTHDDTFILDRGWLHTHTLPLLDEDDEEDVAGQAIGVWLFESGPNTLSVIARKRPSQGGSDFLIGYEIPLGRTQEEEEEEERGRVGPRRLTADTGPLDSIDGTAPFLRTNFAEQNLFHLLVPREDRNSRKSRIEHYVQEKSILGRWQHVATLQPPDDVAGTKITAVAFVQSSQGKFEAVARVTSPNQPKDYLVGYELDVTALSQPLDKLDADALRHLIRWSPPFKLFADSGLIGVTGTPILIESITDDKDLFHMLVPDKDTTVHYTLPVGFFRGSEVRRWQGVAQLSSFQGLTVTAVSLVEDLAGGLAAVTHVQRPQGDEYVVGYELPAGQTQWSEGAVLEANDGPILSGNRVDDGSPGSIG